MGDWALVDTMVTDGLWEAFNNYHMGNTAENIAERWGISREEQDAFALASQQKAAAAMTAGRFNDEILPLQIPQRKGDPIIVVVDEQPRPETQLSSLSSLRAAFKKNGTVTAGNSVDDKRWCRYGHRYD